MANQIEYSETMSQMYQQSKAIQHMVAAYGAEHVQGDSNVQATLKRIEDFAGVPTKDLYSTTKPEIICFAGRTFVAGPGCRKCSRV